MALRKRNKREVANKLYLCHVCSGADKGAHYTVSYKLPRGFSCSRCGKVYHDEVVAVRNGLSVSELMKDINV